MVIFMKIFKIYFIKWKFFRYIFEIFQNTKYLYIEIIN
jgi:hypothetical protein